MQQLVQSQKLQGQQIGELLDHMPLQEMNKSDVDD